MTIAEIREKLAAARKEYEQRSEKFQATYREHGLYPSTTRAFKLASDARGEVQRLEILLARVLRDFPEGGGDAA